MALRWSSGFQFKAAEAQKGGRVNVTRPPATGSLRLMAVTVTTSGAGKAVGTPVDWPLLEVTVIVKPLDSKAPMSTVPLTMQARPRLVGRDAGEE